MTPRVFWLCCLGGLVGLMHFYRGTMFSYGDLIIGDPGDTRFYTVILEHWWNVLRGLEPWRSPPFFYPVQELLSYSDSVWVFAIPYIPLRAAGIDSMTAHQVALLFVSSLAFTGMLSLLGRKLRVAAPIALTGAYIFAFSRYNYQLSIHSQMYATALLPWMIVLAMTYWQKVKDPWPSRMPAAIGFLALLSLTGMSSMYVLWFTALLLTLAIVPAALLFRSDWKRVIGTKWLSSNWLHLFLYALIGAVLLSPIALVYGKQGAHLQDGHWMSVMSSLPDPVLGSLGGGLIAVTVAAFVAALLQQIRSRGALTSGEARFCILAGIVILGGWALIVRQGSSSLWWYVFNFFPGGRSIRVVWRMQQMLLPLMVMVSCLGMNALWRREKHLPRSSQGFSVAIVAMCVWLMYEQHTQYGGLWSKLEVQTRLSRVPPVPSSCPAFFMAFSVGDGRPAAYRQLDAMQISQRDHVPTINGYSGYFPDGWDLLELLGDEAVAGAKRWAQRSGVAGFCIYRIDNPIWETYSLLP